MRWSAGAPSIAGRAARACVRGLRVLCSRPWPLKRARAPLKPSVVAPNEYCQCVRRRDFPAMPSRRLHGCRCKSGENGILDVLSVRKTCPLSRRRTQRNASDAGVLPHLTSSETEDVLQIFQAFSVAVKLPSTGAPSVENLMIAQWCAALNATLSSRVRLPSHAIKTPTPFFYVPPVAVQWDLLVSEPGLLSFFSGSDELMGSAQWPSPWSVQA